MLVAEVPGRFVMPGAFDQIDDARVLSGGRDLPLPMEPPLTRKVVQALLADPYRLEEQWIVRRVQEDIVEGQVEIVVGIEVPCLDGLDHGLVESPHLPRLGFANANRSMHQYVALERADDLVEMSNIIEGQATHLDPAPGEDRYESLELELDQSISQGLAADSKFRGQPLLVDERPRLKIP